MSFHSEVQQQQDVDVTSNLDAVISKLKTAIIRAARNGEKRIILNDMVAGMSFTERNMMFKAANAVVAERGFSQRNHYVGQAGRYKNASGDLFIYVIEWE